MRPSPKISFFLNIFYAISLYFLNFYYDDELLFYPYYEKLLATFSGEVVIGLYYIC